MIQTGVGSCLWIIALSHETIKNTELLFAHLLGHKRDEPITEPGPKQAVLDTCWVPVTC